MLKHSKHVDILDTTLRDGSYTIGYQFTTDETALIAQGLELAGVNYIEVGHGLGLGADRAGKGAQAVTDVLYMRACANSIHKAKFGFFFIPGIGGMADLKLLADEGGKFLRVGIALEAADQACQVIEAAKELGLEVWANIMKTYAYPVKECKEWALRFIQAGADGVYIVDSAGGMLPTEVAEYASEIKAAFNGVGSNARVGFHGHDNLSLSTACSLSAIQAGCDIVDGSLLGIGRSIGNTATEVLAMVLARAGYETGVNAWYAADLAEKTIRPFLEQRWRHSTLDQALGFAQIHSGFLPVLEKVSDRKSVSIRDIVLALGNNARQNITEADAMAAADFARELAYERYQKAHIDHGYIQDRPITTEFPDIEQPDLVKYAAEIRSQSLRMARPATIVVAGPWREDAHNEIRLQQIRLLAHAVVGAIEVSNANDLERVILAIDGAVDILFLDKTPRIAKWDEMIGKLESRKWQSRVLPYADEIAGLIAACHIVAIESNKRGSMHVAVMGSDARAQMVRSLFPYWGLRIADHKLASIIVIAGKIDIHEPLFHSGLTLVYDLMSGAINSEIAKDLLARRVEVIRLDGRAALVGEVIGLLDAQKLADRVMGRAGIGGVPVVAGGVWGNAGDVVVNSILEPTQVIGIADGNGGIKSQLSNADVRALDSVRSTLRATLLAGFTGFNFNAKK
jgi:4-hydroxy-2-oxovalerate aldolase